MECFKVREILSAYYDNELSTDRRNIVDDHIAGCDNCARELSEYRSLSAKANELTFQESTQHIWHQLDAKQDRKSGRPSFFNGLAGMWKKPTVRGGLAIVVLISIGWFACTYWIGHDHNHQMAVVFGEYLETFSRDPSLAQQVLLGSYEGQSMEIGQAVRVVGYRPAVADELPKGYTIAEIYVMKMPCCTCVECLCHRVDGTTFAVFEHNDLEANWFDNRLQTEAICSGTLCSLVELEKGMAATWRRGKRHITVVGAQNVDEVTDLVAWLDDRRPILPQ